MLIGALLLTACGGDDATDDPTDGATTAPEDAGTATEAPTAAGGGEAVVVTAVDYAYEGLSAELAAGTTVTLENASDAEVHEILAFRLPDDETRDVGELMSLSEEELGPLLDMRGVALAAPGSDSTVLPGPPLTVEQPGRYLFACFIPTGAPPDEVMAAVAAFVEAGAPEGEGPAYPQTGPPHAAQGMFAEVTVT